MFTDKLLTCSDCGVTFLFTAGEQEFYQRHELTAEPKRCPTCRQARKAQRQHSGHRLGEDPSHSSEPSARPLYSALCAVCGQEALVPFKPRLEKPVYCTHCFRLQRRSGESRSSNY